MAATSSSLSTSTTLPGWNHTSRPTNSGEGSALADDACCRTADGTSSSCPCRVLRGTWLAVVVVCGGCRQWQAAHLITVCLSVNCCRNAHVDRLSGAYNTTGITRGHDNDDNCDSSSFQTASDAWLWPFGLLHAASLRAEGEGQGSGDSVDAGEGAAAANSTHSVVVCALALASSTPLSRFELSPPSL